MIQKVSRVLSTNPLFHMVLQFSLGNLIPSQLIPIAKSILNIPGRQSEAVLELVFQAKDISPLGFKSYFVEKAAEKVMTEEELADDNVKVKSLQHITELRSFKTIF